ncbi:MAG: hypothetical protein H9917_03435 [Candidatus Oceanisphaera merdipullorum]|nr:hypothetical protein [Candidatus Oceanisphaera merdipullorum]
MNPDHIKRIIERIEPADREALEQYLAANENRHKTFLQCLDDNKMVSHERDALITQNELFRTLLTEHFIEWEKIGTTGMSLGGMTMSQQPLIALQQTALPKPVLPPPMKVYAQSTKK